MKGKLALLIIIIGIICIAAGAIFAGLGMVKNGELKEAMRVEKITLGLTGEQIAAGDILDSAAEAQTAGDTIREHRHGIAATYNDLLAGGKFDPANPQHVVYMQALNLENYLYLAVIGFGLTQVTMASGFIMMLTGIAFFGIGMILRSERPSQERAP